MSPTQEEGAVQKALRPIAGITSGLTIVGLGLLLAYVAWQYLSQYPSSPWLAAMITLVSLGLGAALLLGLTRKGNSFLCLTAICVCLGLHILVLGSATSGSVTHARFGLTVVGALPIPSLDVTINSDGRLWFRDKSHRVTLDEVLPLIDDTTEAIVIAIGWDEQVKVDKEVVEKLGPRALIQETSKALETYKKLRAEGKRVALLAHSTC